MADGGLKFDAATHTYRVGAAVVPGVTRLLAPLLDYSMVREELMRLAAERGSAVHKACELDDLNDLDEDALDPVLGPYLTAWRAFKRDTAFEPLEVEQTVFHPLHRYAGTLDRVGRVLAKVRVIEIKAVSTLLPATAIQTAAYADAYKAGGGKHRFDGRCAVQLLPNGQYRMKVYDGRGDFAVFLSLLTLHHWKEANNV